MAEVYVQTSTEDNALLTSGGLLHRGGGIPPINVRSIQQTGQEIPSVNWMPVPPKPRSSIETGLFCSEKRGTELQIDRSGQASQASTSSGAQNR